MLPKAPCSWEQLWELSPFASRSLCTDNLWSDQSLEMDTDLPPGWRKIHDTLGTYYWHVPTGTTQWQHPAHTTSPGGCLKADGEETLQETVGDVGRGVLGPTTRQKAAMGGGGLLKDPLSTLSCLPWSRTLSVTQKSCSWSGLSPLKDFRRAHVDPILVLLRLPVN